MKRVPKKRVDYTDWTVEEHEDYLRTHPPYLAAYAKYEPKSVEKFIEDYARRKFEMYEHQERYKESYEEHQTQFLTAAEAFIDMILQKKLFNLQCQWRAKQIDLPLVHTTYDFEHWEENIRACPFIEPVRPDEIDLCVRYLKEEVDFSEDMEIGEWQCHWFFKNQLIREEFEDNPNDVRAPVKLPHENICRELPEFYVYFDLHQNTSDLFFLPDIRGDIEKRYEMEGRRLKKAREEAALKAKGEWKEPEPMKPWVEVPYLSLYSRQCEDFVEEAEDEDTKELYKQYQHSMYGDDDSGISPEIEDCIEFLRKFNEPIPIEAGDDWTIALLIATRKFKQAKIIEMMPYAYDTYLLEFDADEPLESLILRRAAHYHYDPVAKGDDFYELKMMVRNLILDGREALDGRRDFDYL